MEVELNNKNYEFDMKIFSNSINRIIYTDKGEFIFDLQCPPKFRTNFLIDSKNNYTYYENIMFPFRNFQNEFSNLKYRRFFILIQKDKNNQSNEDKDTYENLKNVLGSIFADNNIEIDRNKFMHINEIKIYKEKEIKNNFKFYKEGKYELSDYFKYNSDDKIHQILKELKFIKESKEKKNDSLLDKPDDEEVIKLFYQIIALVSEGILSYYHAIEFTENILFQKNNDYKENIFSKLELENSDTDLYPIFFNLVLTKILNKYQNSLEEQSLAIFESNLKITFEEIYAEYVIKGLENIEIYNYCPSYKE